LLRRRVLRTGGVYLVLSWLLYQLLVSGAGVDGAPRRLVQMILWTGFPMALLFAWLFHVSREGVEIEHYDTGPRPRSLTGWAFDLGIVALLALILAATLLRLVPN
jgi:hypothetical protein